MVELKRGTAPPTLLDPPMIMTERTNALPMYFGDCNAPCTYNVTRDRYHQGWLLVTWRKATFLPHFFPWQSKHSSISVSHVFLTLLLLYYMLSHQGYNWNSVKSFVTKNKRVCTATKKTPQKGGEWSWGDLILIRLNMVVIYGLDNDFIFIFGVLTPPSTII